MIRYLSTDKRNLQLLLPSSFLSFSLELRIQRFGRISLQSSILARVDVQKRRDLTREKRNPLAYELDTRVPPHSTHDGFSFRRYSQFVVYERGGETGTGTVLLVSPWRNGDSLMARPGDWMRCDGNFVGKSSAIFQRAKMTDRILDTRPPLQCFAQG